MFVRNGREWAQRAYTKASNTAIGDFFGSSIALSHDTLVVGARSEDSATTGSNGNQSDNNVSDAGAIYIFR